MQQLVQEQAKEQAINQTINYKMASQQTAALETQAMLDKREILVQVTQWQQDRTPAMRELFMKLCGAHYDIKTKELDFPQWARGYVDQFGAYKLVSFIETLDRNVMLGNWSERNLIITMRDAIAHPLRRYIFFNHAELGLQVQHAEYVFWTIVNAVEPTYWRGFNNGERRMNMEMIKVEEHRHPDMQQKRKTVFGLEAA